MIKRPIPESAVEAAYEAFWEDGEGDSRAFLRKALEAAATHMICETRCNFTEV